MTILARLEQWKEQGSISLEQHAHLASLARGEPFSLFLELNVLLYAGVLAFVAGLGWTVTTWSQQLGDVLVLTILSTILATCFWYCFSRAPALSRAETPAPSPVFDYVLYLGSLVWCVELAYLENRFHVLSGQWDLYLLATAGFFFFLAYRFDNRFVLSLALSSLAGWFGLTISHWPSHQDAGYRRYALLYCLLVGGGGVLLQRRGLGMQAALFSGSPYSPKPEGAHFLVPAAGAVFSLWIWHRFGHSYAFLAAMIFALFLPGYWTSSHSAQHVIVAVFYATGLICTIAVRSRHRFDYVEDAYSRIEAFLWLGIYLAINLKVSSLNLPAQWWGGGTRATSEFARPFYWATWVLIWCLPSVVIERGVRLKDRFVIAVGAIVAILTFVSNKPYLGWQRHSWDPMLLGVLLTGVALFIRRWLARGPGGIRHGFTAARLSGKDKHWMNAGSAVLGLVSPQSITPSPQTSSPDFRFGGGASGGGGAGGDF